MVLSKTPVEIIYDVNFETGRIEEMLVGILRTTEGKIDYLRIDTDVMYTMSASLYSSLTPDNTTLPQTVTFSELYRYYHNDKAFDAGRRMRPRQACSGHFGSTWVASFSATVVSGRPCGSSPKYSTMHPRPCGAISEMDSKALPFLTTGTISLTFQAS